MNHRRRPRHIPAHRGAVPGDLELLQTDSAVCKISDLSALKVIDRSFIQSQSNVFWMNQIWEAFHRAYQVAKCIVLASNFDHRTLGELMSWGNLSAFYIVKQYLRSHILQNVPLASPEMKAVQPLPDFIVTLITEAHLLAPPVLKRAVLEISCLRCSQVFRPPSFVAAVFLFSLLKHVEGQTKRQF